MMNCSTCPYRCPYTSVDQCQRDYSQWSGVTDRLPWDDGKQDRSPKGGHPPASTPARSYREGMR